MTASKPTITFEKHISPETLSTISNGVRHFGAPYLGGVVSQDFCFLAHNELGTLIGGITCVLMGDHIWIDWMWVDAAHRNQGLGSHLLKDLDTYARRQSCRFIQLETYDFQARPFYEKSGYICISTIEKWLHGRDCYFMRKIL